MPFPRLTFGRPRTALLAVALLAVAPGAPAGAKDCTASSQAGLDACAGDAYKAADARLNATYRQVAARLAGDAAARELLVAAQRAWIGFRDAECRFRSSGVAGGSAQPMVVTQCLTGLTEARTTGLASLLACQEGDLSCPVPAAP